MPWKCYQQHLLVTGDLLSVGDRLLESINTWGPSIINSNQLKNSLPKGIHDPHFSDRGPDKMLLKNMIYYLLEVKFKES